MGLSQENMQMTLDLDFTDSKRGVSRRLAQSTPNEPKNVVKMHVPSIKHLL